MNNQFYIPFSKTQDLQLHKKKILPYHTNGMKFTALDGEGKTLASMNYYSVGGGFFVSEDDVKLEIEMKKKLKEQ